MAGLFRRSKNSDGESVRSGIAVPPFGQERDEQFAAALARLTELKSKVEASHGWYRSHADRNMTEFYASGLALVVLSVSLPFVSSQEFAWKDTAVSVMSLCIAILSAVIAFHRWEQSWSQHRQTQMALDYLLEVWKLKIVDAKNQATPELAIASAVKATESLISEARSVESTEAQRFFDTLREQETQL